MNSEIDPHRKESHQALRVIGSAAVWTLVVALLAATGLGDFVSERLARPMQFRVRELLGRSPVLDPRLKIFVLDDTTVSKMGAAELSPTGWVEMLIALGERRPRGIYIDKLFGVASINAPVASDVLARFHAMASPVVVGAFLAPRAIGGRAVYELDGREYERDAMLRTADADYGDNDSAWVYGPSGVYAPVFRRVGHILGAERTLIRAWVPAGERRVIPHLSLVAGEPMTVRGDRLYLGETELPTIDGQHLPVNMAPPQVFYKRAARLLNLIEPDSRATALATVAPGDVVLILPAMHTGSTDFTTSPFGLLPGGFVIASVINSVLSGAWIAEVRQAWVFTAVMALAGALIRFASPPLLAWLLVVFGMVAWTGIALAAFVYGSWLLDPIFPAVAFLGAALAALAKKHRIAELMVGFMRFLEAERRRMASELETAAEISRSLIPAQAPDWPGIDASAFHRPLAEASGDWMQFERSRSGRYYHAVLCDITGHGVQAAIVAATCSTALSMTVRTEPEALESKDFHVHFLRSLNAVLVRQGKGGHTTTYLGLTFSLDTHEVHVVAMGHPPPILVRREGVRAQFMPLASRNDLLGMKTADEDPKMLSHPFMPGDEIVGFSDGAPVRQQMRAFKSFFQLRDASAEPDAAGLVRALLDAENAASKPSEDDDICLIWFRAKPSAVTAVGTEGPQDEMAKSVS